MQDMPLGSQVRIGGRTMLRPGFSLVGCVGLIVSSQANAPAGTRAVWIDWEACGRDSGGEDLPPVVNVPAEYLELVVEEAPEKKPASPATDEPPRLRLV